MPGYLVLLPVLAAGHGYGFDPPSRQREANEKALDYCPHCVLASPMRVKTGRGWPGEQAFSEPGRAPSATHVTTSGLVFGVCGARNDNDYNVVTPSWGLQSITVAPGDILTTSWCVNADHGGVYSWRMCDDKNLTDLFLSNKPLTQLEQKEAEACFQRGILRCDDAPGNDCRIGPRCRRDWGCAEPGKYFHCNSQCRNQN